MDAADTDPDRPLFDAARRGDVSTLTALLDAHPEQLYAREKPYDMTLLHLAARHLPVVDLLLQRGLDVNLRDGADNSYAMHWASAAGSLDVVRRLADAGGDVIGRGDDHGLEVIGWATCWGECDDDAHRAVVAFLIGRGARHHIFSAVALGLADEVRRIVAGDSSALGRRQSRNENNQTPLHFAVQRHQPDMIALLLQLGADPLAVDGWGTPVSIHATTPEADRPVMQAIRALMEGELVSAARGHRPPRGGAMDLWGGTSSSTSQRPRVCSQTAVSDDTIEPGSSTRRLTPALYEPMRMPCRANAAHDPCCCRIDRYITRPRTE